MKALALFASLAALAALSSAQATYSSNFDALTANSTLAGQDGWVLGSSGSTVNTPAVSSAVSYSPANSVFLTYAGTGGSFTSAGHSFAAGTSATNRYLAATAKVYVGSVSGADRYFGIGLGTSALCTTGFAGVALGGNGLRGGAGSYASYNSVTGGLLESRTTADFLNRWVTVSMIADRGLTSDNVTFAFSGLGTTGGSATESFTKSVNFGTTNLTTIQIFNDWGSTSTVQGSAYVDDVIFYAGNTQPVPEPSALAALGLGALALLRRRRRA